MVTSSLTLLQVAVAPDGNGGIYQALITSNARSDMKKRGIEHVHAYCVDNCLVRVADPVFIGFATSKKVNIATKVVRKRNASEPVGLIVLKNGKPDVVEYSEMDENIARAIDPHHSDMLKFRAANIVNHYYSSAFLDTIENWSYKLPHHVARKKIPCVDMKTGENTKPDKPNGVKLEQFVFDVFPFLSLDKFASLEVDRKDDFSPLKNAKGTGEDDPDTSKKDILNQGTRWVKAAGAIVVSEQDSSDEVEVSPLISYVSGSQSIDENQYGYLREDRAEKAWSTSREGRSRRLRLLREKVQTKSDWVLPLGRRGISCTGNRQQSGQSIVKYELSFSVSLSVSFSLPLTQDCSCVIL